MKPINCGVFDERTRLCLHCGKSEEGTQCTLEYNWRTVDVVFHAAKLLYGSLVVLDEPLGRVFIIDGLGQSTFDPILNDVQAYFLTHRLLHNHRCVIKYNHDILRFMIMWDRTQVVYAPLVPGSPGNDAGAFESAEKVAYPMTTRAAHLGWGLTVMAAKLWLMKNYQLWPKNLQYEEVPQKLSLTF